VKIGMVSEFYYPQPGGISEHIRALSRELRMLDIDVTVITSNIKGDVHERDPRVIRLGRSLPIHYNGSLSRVSVGRKLGARFDEILEKENFDLLHIHNPLMPTLPLLAMKRARCPLVATFHSFYPRDRMAQTFRPVLSRYLKNLDARVAVSPSARRVVETMFPADYRIIPNGVDYDYFAEAAGKKGSSLLGLSEDRLKILFVGALVKRKGLPHLLKAFTELCKQRQDVELLVVGDGPDRKQIQRQLPASIRDLVHFVGFVPRQKLIEYFANADLFCAPSMGRESFGMVLIEAMAAGLPVVGFNIDGYRDVVSHGQDGLLVEPGNRQALTQALDYLLNNPDEREAYARRGRIKAARFSWREISVQIDAVYRDVLGMPARQEPEPLVDVVTAGS
jgi:phosphatidyl-myo-inositol alpha-mannosyltransferase